MRIITSDNVASFVKDGALQMEEGWTLAPSALEYLRRGQAGPVQQLGHRRARGKGQEDAKPHQRQERGQEPSVDGSPPDCDGAAVKTAGQCR